MNVPHKKLPLSSCFVGKKLIETNAFEFNIGKTKSKTTFKWLFNNPENYDVKFVIDDKQIFACKSFLKFVSGYFNKMFSGEWLENDQVNIVSYSYDTYYAYLQMLHDGSITINNDNIGELIDIARCHLDEQLKTYCINFLGRELNQLTVTKYLPLIQKYELVELNDSLIKLAINDIFPSLSSNHLFSNDESKIQEFFHWFYNEQSFFDKSLSK